MIAHGGIGVPRQSFFHLLIRATKTIAPMHGGFFLGRIVSVALNQQTVKTALHDYSTPPHRIRTNGLT